MYSCNSLVINSGQLLSMSRNGLVTNDITLVTECPWFEKGTRVTNGRSPRGGNIYKKLAEGKHGTEVAREQTHTYAHTHLWNTKMFYEPCLMGECK